MAHARASDRSRGPAWLRQRSIGKLPPVGRHMSPSTELMQRLGQEASMDGHRGCVNCLDWNRRGDLLASGSDDTNVIIWDAFKRKKQNVIKTGHEGIIFSVKFMPNSSDTLVATCASDGQVKVTSIYQNNENVFNCNRCHKDRVKRLAVHPDEPNLIWSAAEDGLVLEYDIRSKHVCNSSRPSNVLVDLKSVSNWLQVKCVAVNPLKSEMLAVGSNDIYNRLFDRRFVRNNSNNNNPDDQNSCTAYYTPGHLLKTHNRSNHIQTYGTTYLSFNSRGTELLASYHAEQVYLFDIRESHQHYQSFEKTLKPLLLGGAQPSRKLATTRPRYKNNNSGKRIRLEASQQSSNEVNHMQFVLSQIRAANEEISECRAGPETYRLRSKMLLERGWRGDEYQALRDCCEALAIEPMDAQTIDQLAETLARLGDLESAQSLAEFLSAHRDLYKSQDEARQLKATLDLHAGYTCDMQLSGGGRCSPIGDHLAYNSSSLPFNLMLSTQQSREPTKDVLVDRCKRDTSEIQMCSTSLDYSERYCGHCNMNTDIKEASFLGPNDEFIVGGSDDGAFYIWNRETANIVKAVHADHHILNCVQPHPNICMLATSGIESAVKLWSPLGVTRRDVKSLDARCVQNQKFISTDPLEAMIMMLYPEVSEGIN